MNFFDTIKTWFKPRTITRTIFLPSGKMAEEEIKTALAVGDQHPLWRAIHQILQDHIDDSRTIASLPEMAEKTGLLKHTVGGCEALESLQRDLLERKNAQ